MTTYVDERQLEEILKQFNELHSVIKKNTILYSIERVRCVKELLTSFFTFLKIGAFTFGGGYAMIPMIQQEIVDKIITW